MDHIHYATEISLLEMDGPVNEKSRLNRSGKSPPIFQSPGLELPALGKQSIACGKRS